MREAASCPPRQTTVTGDQSNTATLAVADTSPFRIGFTLTVPQTNANGTITNTTRLIRDIPDSTHLVLASAVATGVGQKVADGTVVSLVCGNANPTPYAEWPDPAAQPVTLHVTPGVLDAAASRSARRPGRHHGDAHRRRVHRRDHVGECSVLDRPADLPDGGLDAAGPHQRLADGRAEAGVQRVQANLTAALVSYPPTGNGTILTRGWIDPANRNTDRADIPVKPGRFYRIDFDMQPKDTVVPAGNRLALMVLSSDRDFTIRPPAGTQLTLDLAGSSLAIPVVGGTSALAGAAG